MTYEETSIKIFIINSMAKSYCLIYPYLIDEPRNASSLFIFGTLHLPGHVQCCFRKYTSMLASGPRKNGMNVNFYKYSLLDSTMYSYPQYMTSGYASNWNQVPSADRRISQLTTIFLVLSLQELLNVLNQMLMETGDAEVMVNVQNSQARPNGVLIYLVSILSQKTLLQK